MEKAFVEVVRFNTADVIATSGVTPTYQVTVANFNTGDMLDVIISFQGNDYYYYDVDSLRQALQPFRLNFITDRSCLAYDDDAKYKNFEQYYNTDVMDNEGEGYLLADGNYINGSYTWYASDSMWRHDD